MKGNQLYRLMNTLFVFWVVGYVCIFILRRPEKKVIVPDPIQEINTTIQSWHQYKWEFMRDIENLNQEKKKLFSKAWFDESVYYYDHGDYSPTLDPEIKWEMRRIDILLASAENRMNAIPDTILVKKQAEVSTGL